jgi:hypothetical protein
MCICQSFYMHNGEANLGRECITSKPTEETGKTTTTKKARVGQPSTLQNPTGPPPAMAAAVESSTSEPAAKEKPIIVRVKRKPSEARPDAFCELLFLSLCYVPFLLEFVRRNKKMRDFETSFHVFTRARN